MGHIIKTITSTALIAFATLGFAELEELSFDEMSGTSGQGILDVVELYDPNNDVKFLRIRTGAIVDINANIDSVILGQQYRDDDYVAVYCPTEGDFSCSRADRETNIASNPTTATGADRAAFDLRETGPFLGTAVDVDGAPDADVIIENLSLGAVLGSALETVRMENPYLEFAFDGSTGKLIGFRTGAEVQNGSIGNSSQNGVCPLNNAACAGIISLSGNLSLDVNLATATVPGVSRATAADLRDQIGIVQLLTGTFGLEIAASVQAIGDLANSDTQEFFLSLQTREIAYAPGGRDGNTSLLINNDNGNVSGGVPGFSLNVTDGIGADGLITIVSGIPKRSNCFNGSLGSC